MEDTNSSSLKKRSPFIYFLIFILVFILYNAIIILVSFIFDRTEFLYNLWIRYAVAGFLSGFVIAALVAYYFRLIDES